MQSYHPSQPVAFCALKEAESDTQIKRFETFDSSTSCSQDCKDDIMMMREYSTDRTTSDHPSRQHKKKGNCSMLESNQHPFAPIQIGMIEIRIDLIGVKSSQRRLVSRGRRMLSIELIELFSLFMVITHSTFYISDTPSSACYGHSLTRWGTCMN
jgi:hypothetical protein